MIELHPIFKFRTQVTEGIISLLESVTLGTDGAHYKHLDTRERIQEADNPLFLSMERHEKVLGNCTFCRRDKNWYIRHFAFDGAMQSDGKKKSSSNGLLKRELNSFFDEQLKSGEVGSFYAYIDPRNVKSLWMSENFGFKTVGKIATQTYSSIDHLKTKRVTMEDQPTKIPQEIHSNFQHQTFYFTEQLKKGTHFSIRNESGELIAFAKTTHAHWEIKRLPGKMGGTLVKLIPFLPLISRLIKPKDHRFVTAEAVYIKDNDPKLLKELFDGILSHTKRRIIFWWVDELDQLYTDVRSQIKWGILDTLIGVNEVHLVERSLSSKPTNQTFYTSGFDFV